jgi:hypothetical protein
MRNLSALLFCLFIFANQRGGWEQHDRIQIKESSGAGQAEMSMLNDYQTCWQRMSVLQS